MRVPEDQEIGQHQTHSERVVRGLTLYSRIVTVRDHAPLTSLRPHPLNPSLIFTRVSGYGQTGPWSSRPGYASVCEAESGFRYINGTPDPDTGALLGPPIRPNLSLGDSVAGLHAAFGTVLLLILPARLL